MSCSDDPKLPHDVAVEILKRLPVESLLRFRCVFRSWRSAIDDPRFVALHLNHSALHASNRYLVCLDWRDPFQSMCSLFSDDSLALPSKSPIEIPFVTPPSVYGFVGSCNGLICVEQISGNGGGQTMYLWNIFTRKHKLVRRSGPEHQFLCRRAAHVVLGFVFDARSNDYKIVRILYCPRNHRRCFGGTKPPVEIYSLSTDSWRSLECEVPAFSYARSMVFSNGKMHWYGFKFDDLWDDGGYASILSFDVASEVFDEMTLREDIFHEVNVGLTVSVAVLNDLLAVFINFVDVIVHPEPHSVCSVWVMMEYGLPKSWTKLYSFEACGLVAGFDGFMRNGELLMEMGTGERVSWDPITGQYANLPLLTQCDLVAVVESLVSL